MILINGNWEQVNNLQDVIRVVGEYYNDELAKRIEGLLPEFSEDDYYDLCNEFEDVERALQAKVSSLEDDIERLNDNLEGAEKTIEELEAQIEELKSQ